jgi:hypothetical protein
MPRWQGQVLDAEDDIVLFDMRWGYRGHMEGDSDKGVRGMVPVGYRDVGNLGRGRYNAQDGKEEGSDDNENFAQHVELVADCGIRRWGDCGFPTPFILLAQAKC